VVCGTVAAAVTEFVTGTALATLGVTVPITDTTTVEPTADV